MIRYPLFRAVLLAVLLIVWCGYALQAQQIPTTTDVPRSISYQGMLTDAGGTPMADGIYEVTVTLYADVNGTQPIWTDTYRAHVIGGVFNLYLGDDGKPLPGPDAMNRRLWIGTSVSGAGEMRPLTPLASSPYALTVPNESITNAKLATGAVTAEKVDMDYVARLRVNGEEIGGKAAVLNIQSSDDINVRYDDASGSLVIGSKSAPNTAGLHGEKGASIQDVTDGSNNWRGRDAGANQPFYGGAPLTYNTLAGGRSTSIATNSDYSTITGGNANTIGNASDCGFIGGGCNNTIATSALRGVISGGSTNAIGAANVGNSIGGGTANSIMDGSDDNVIDGGAGNIIEEESDNNVIGGGSTNTIAAAGSSVSWATIGGGRSNKILSTGTYGVVGGGEGNEVNGDWGTIGGGISNLVSEPRGVIAGGEDNNVLASAGAVTGGLENTVSVGAGYSIVGAGKSNLVESPLSAIGGGFDNTIATSATNSFIGGGDVNLIASGADYATIGAGRSNEIDASLSAIVGGFDNTISSSATNSFIGGGDVNLIASSAEHGTIGGGQMHKLEGKYSTIPGGDRLWTWPSYAQTAVGFYNAPRGAVTVHPSAGALTDDPLFMVGNGDVNAVSRSNAFEVSYNGHSVVYHRNGSGSGAAAIRGATYTDNIVYAWAEVDANGDIPCGDFGVGSIVHTGVGEYDVTLNLIHPVAGSDIPLNCIAVTATINGDDCGLITTKSLAVGPPTVFKVRTFNPGGNCDPADYPFTFQVTGRP